MKIQVANSEFNITQDDLGTDINIHIRFRPSWHMSPQEAYDVFKCLTLEQCLDSEALDLRNKNED